MQKEEFIGSVRETLGKGKGPPDTPYPRLQDTLAQIEERATAVRARLAGHEETLLTRLAEVSQARGWRVQRASDVDEALDYVCKLASASGAELVVRSDEDIFKGVNVDSALSGAGVEVMVMAKAQAPDLSREALRQRAATAGIGITGVDYAIAETGSVVVLPRKGLSRLVSLLPPIHIALVRPQDVVESLEDLFALRRLAYYQGDGNMGSYMNFITGPSRTADIEQTLVIGVHGPKEAHLVLLEQVPV